MFLNFSIGTFSNFSENFKRPSSLSTNLYTATAIIQGSKNYQYRLVCHMSFEPRVFPVFMIFSKRLRCCMEWAIRNGIGWFMIRKQRKSWEFTYCFRWYTFDKLYKQWFLHFEQWNSFFRCFALLLMRRYRMDNLRLLRYNQNQGFTIWLSIGCV